MINYIPLKYCLSRAMSRIDDPTIFDCDETQKCCNEYDSNAERGESELVFPVHFFQVLPVARVGVLYLRNVDMAINLQRFDFDRLQRQNCWMVKFKLEVFVKFMIYEQRTIMEHYQKYSGQLSGFDAASAVDEYVLVNGYHQQRAWGYRPNFCCRRFF